MSPLKAMRRCVQFFSNENELVYEPFCGVGTVPVACEILNRRWVATELNSTYIETTNNRIMKVQRGIL
jgi:DNA modification methylase